MNEALKPILAELKQRLTDLYGERLSQLILFGSQARGDATEDSDVDVLVVLEGEKETREEHERRLDIICDMNIKYGLLVVPHIMSAERYRTRNSPLILNVRHEGVGL
ncbi:MAG: nucleotidyltransferase domain-containing protein [Calditrichaeota bacterium]|nr:nucleotidyltransferase domain-containing protein [Calditrichota bacterium]